MSGDSSRDSPSAAGGVTESPSPPCSYNSPASSPLPSPFTHSPTIPAGPQGTAVPTLAPPPQTRRAPGPGPRPHLSIQERRRRTHILVVDTMPSLPKTTSTVRVITTAARREATRERETTNTTTRERETRAGHGHLPMVVQTADTLSRLRRLGWDDLQTPTPQQLPSVPLPAAHTRSHSGSDDDNDDDYDDDSDLHNDADRTDEDWIRRAFAADAFRPAPEMMSSEYQLFPVVMELQRWTPAPGQPRRTPLFMIHPDAGYAVAYLGLPNLGRPVYGLSNTYLANGLAFRSIHCAAQIYLKHIRAILNPSYYRRRRGRRHDTADEGEYGEEEEEEEEEQGTGERPFLLAGWGLGGNIAREVGALLSHEWAEREAREDDEVRAARRASRRVVVLLLDSYRASALDGSAGGGAEDGGEDAEGDGEDGARESDVIPPPAVAIPSITLSPAMRSPHSGGHGGVRAQRKLISSARLCSPCCPSPSGKGMQPPPPPLPLPASPERSLAINAALVRALAAGTVSHLRDQYRLSTTLLKEEDPMPFARRVGSSSTNSIVVHPRDVVKSSSIADLAPRTTHLDSFAHVFLLKAGRLGGGGGGHSSSYQERAYRARRFFSRVNGWDTAELAPGLCPGPGPRPRPRQGRTADAHNGDGPDEDGHPALGQVRTIPFTHQDMFSAAGCEQVGAWIRACLAAADV